MAYLVVLSLLALSACPLPVHADRVALAASDPDVLYRPSVHFSPEAGFMNDPNGLLYLDGTYHLYYQLDPFAPVAGHVHWGHAISKDLYSWVDMPIAINETVDGQAFTGSAVNDTDNTSGLFPAGSGGIVAIYTRATTTTQTQFIASSPDGVFFTDFSGNPVLNLNTDSFRDPKVFFHAPTGKWVMTVAHSRDHQIGIYVSTDLRNWNETSRFGPAGLIGFDFECPNLVEVPVVGGGSRWVLFVSINPGSPQGGSATQYFVGSFDGLTFTSDLPSTAFIDFAKDFYALQFYNNIDQPNPITISWLGNWQYCQQVPTNNWRGIMTLPRQVALVQAVGGLRVAQVPVGVDELRDLPLPMDNSTLAAGSTRQIAIPTGVPIQVRISVEIASGTVPGRFSLQFANDGGETLTVGWDQFVQQIWVDRGGLTGFDSPFLTDRFSAPVQPNVQIVDFHLILDGSAFELFTQGGLEVATALVYPSAPLTQLRLRSTGADSIIHEVAVYTLVKTMTDRNTDEEAA